MTRVKRPIVPAMGHISSYDTFLGYFGLMNGFHIGRRFSRKVTKEAGWLCLAGYRLCSGLSRQGITYQVLRSKIFGPRIEDTMEP